jgi:hypothetical protein
MTHSPNPTKTNQGGILTEGSFFFRSGGFWVKGLNGTVERFEQRTSVRLVHYSDAASYSKRPVHLHPPQQSTLDVSGEVWEAFWAYLDIADAWNQWNNRHLQPPPSKPENGDWALQASLNGRHLNCSGTCFEPVGFLWLHSFMENAFALKPYSRLQQELEYAKKDCAVLGSDAPTDKVIEWICRAQYLVPLARARQLAPQCLPHFYDYCQSCLDSEYSLKEDIDRLGPILLSMLDAWGESAPLEPPPTDLMKRPLSDDLCYALIKIASRSDLGQQALWAAFEANQGTTITILGQQAPLGLSWQARVLQWASPQPEISWKQFYCVRDWVLRDSDLAKAILGSPAKALKLHCYRPELVSPAVGVPQLCEFLLGDFGMEAAQRLMDWLGQPACRPVIAQKVREALQSNLSTTDGPAWLAAQLGPTAFLPVIETCLDGEHHHPEVLQRNCGLLKGLVYFGPMAIPVLEKVSHSTQTHHRLCAVAALSSLQPEKRADHQARLDELAADQRGLDGDALKKLAWSFAQANAPAGLAAYPYLKILAQKDGRGSIQSEIAQVGQAMERIFLPPPPFWAPPVPWEPEPGHTADAPFDLSEIRKQARALSFKMTNFSRSEYAYLECCGALNALLEHLAQWPELQKLQDCLQRAQTRIHQVGRLGLSQAGAAEMFNFYRHLDFIEGRY